MAAAWVQAEMEARQRGPQGAATEEDEAEGGSEGDESTMGEEEYEARRAARARGAKGIAGARLSSGWRSRHLLTAASWLPHAPLRLPSEPPCASGTPSHPERQHVSGLRLQPWSGPGCGEDEDHLSTSPVPALSTAPASPLPTLHPVPAGTGGANKVESLAERDEAAVAATRARLAAVAAASGETGLDAADGAGLGDALAPCMLVSHMQPHGAREAEGT